MREAHSRRPEDFKRRIVKRVFTSKEDLIIEEQRWLDMIDYSELGTRYYNKTLRSTMPSFRGCHHSKETIRLISASNLGKKRSDETKQKVREASIRQFSVEDNRRKHSEIVKSLWLDAAYRANQIEKIQQVIRKPLSEETKEKISKANKGKVLSDKHKQQISERMTGNKYKAGKPVSEETKRKISIKNTGKKHTDEFKKNVSENMKKHWKMKKEGVMA